MKIHKPHTPYLELLRALQKRIRSKLLGRHELHCEIGEWLDCAVLKLQKKNWTKNGLGEGVFFSVWIGEKVLKRNRFNYNIPNSLVHLAALLELEHKRQPQNE